MAVCTFNHHCTWVCVVLEVGMGVGVRGGESALCPCKGVLEAELLVCEVRWCADCCVRVGWCVCDCVS